MSLVVKITWDQNYGAWSENIPDCAATHDTYEGVKEAFRRALDFHMEGLLEDGDLLPEILQGGHPVLDFEPNVKTILKSLEGVITRSALSKETGINKRQLDHHLSGVRNAKASTREKIIMGESISDRIDSLVSA